MNRLKRRLTLLRAKRNGCFDANQHYLERAVRARAARRIRTYLRRGLPVVLVTPRWSRADRFLDDVAVDLGVGEPETTARVLSLMWLQGKGTHDTWTWLVRAISELCDVEVSGPVSQAVDRHGFRHVVSQLLERVQTGGRRVLLMHGVQYLNLEARNDLIRVFEEHVERHGSEARFNLLMASAVDSPTFEVKNARRVFLPDFGSDEAVEALIEYLGPHEHAALRKAVSLAGGVPSVLHAVGAHAESSGELAGSRDAVWRVIGPLAGEIRDASAIVSSDDALASRLEALAGMSSVPRDDETDHKLIVAGLAKDVLVGRTGRVALRAPFFSDLSNGS